VDLGVRAFRGVGASAKADQTIDLLNNDIGRRIGRENPSAGGRNLAIAVLGYYHSTGLYTK
jgi:hypothetical protein